MLLADESRIDVSPKYCNYAYIFSPNLVIGLLEYISINNHAIKLEKNKEPLYSLIYSRDLLDLKTLKTYISIYLKIGFIRPFKFPARAFILFDQK